MTPATRRSGYILSQVASHLPAKLFVHAVAMTYGRVEGELRRLDDYLPRGGTALDVGTWYGPWTHAFARRCDNVISFEPNPKVADVLRRTMPAHVRVVESVAGDEPGTEATLWVPASGMGTEGVASTISHGEGDVPVAVPMSSVDTEVYNAGVSRVAVIKIDVEGAEQAVLKGATRTLTEHRPVLIVELEYHRAPVDTTLRFLEDLGYRGQVLVKGNWVFLTDFDLAAHQEEARPQFEGGGLVRRMLKGGHGYVNNVVFLPQ